LLLQLTAMMFIFCFGFFFLREFACGIRPPSTEPSEQKNPCLFAQPKILTIHSMIFNGGNTWPLQSPSCLPT